MKRLYRIDDWTWENKKSLTARIFAKEYISIQSITYHAHTRRINLEPAMQCDTER